MTTPRQLHDLPSLRGGGPDVGFGARPRPGRRLLVVGALLVVAVAGLRAADTSAAEGEAAPEATPDVTAAEDAAARRATAITAADQPAPAVASSTPPMAEVGDLTLHAVADEVLVVGYHEASKAGALGMTPVGTGLSNANTTRITLPPDRDGTDYHVMSSRGRVLPPTSAVDVVVRDDVLVRSPVDGEVVEVRPYALYGTHPDTRIEIRPDDAPHLRVVLIHVAEPQVAAGDRVAAGATVVAGTATRFPFASHVDRYLDERWPHVHLEVVDPTARE